VPALDEYVGGHDHLSFRRGQHGRVVTRPEQHPLPLREELAQGSDETELAKVGKRLASLSGGT